MASPALTIWTMYVCHACGWRMASEQPDLSCEQCGGPRSMVEAVSVVPVSLVLPVLERLVGCIESYQHPLSTPVAVQEAASEALVLVNQLKEKDG